MKFDVLEGFSDFLAKNVKGRFDWPGLLFYLFISTSTTQHSTSVFGNLRLCANNYYYSKYMFYNMFRLFSF